MKKQLISKNPKYNEYQREIAAIVHKCFNKTFSGSVIINQIISNQQLVDESHKPIITKLCSF